MNQTDFRTKNRDVVLALVAEPFGAMSGSCDEP